MEATKRTSRIHPLYAAAAVSLIVVSLAGTAAITGLLPSSHSAPDISITTPQNKLVAMPSIASQGAAVPAAVAPAPVIIRETVIREVPVKHVSSKPRVVPRHTDNLHNDASNYYAPAPQRVPQQPNYVAIGTGAVVGGLLGNQVGSGNGRKLATIAGLIGGGILGNQIADRNR